MDSTERNVLIIGGLGIGAILLFSFLKQQAANQIAAANQPGLVYQPAMPAPSSLGVLGDVLSGVSIGSSALGSIFSSFGNFSTANDPGLESGEDDIAYPGQDYTYANSNSYGDGGYAPLATDASADDQASYSSVFDD